MKIKFVLFLLIFTWVTFSHAQLTVQAGFTAQQLADHLSGPGFTVTNATLTGHPASRGKFVSNGTNLGVDSGVILSTGSILQATGPAIDFASTGFGYPGNADLDNVAQTQTNDAAILEFDFVVESDRIQFNFVFASEEYPEFAPPMGGINDVFAFYISGPGIVGQENVALIPGSTTPVSINNINAVTHWQYYVDNQNGTQVAYDAFTTKLSAIRTGLTPCSTYHLSLRIADAADDIYDSAVFLEENSLVQGSVTAITNTVSGDSVALEGCVRASFTFDLDSVYSTPTPISITVGGTATNGVDYAYIDSLIVIPPGQQSATVFIDAVADGFNEGQETVTLSYHPDPCSPPQQVVLYIQDNTPIGFNSTFTNVGCAGGNNGQINLTVSGGTPPYTVVLNGVDTFATTTISGLAAGTYVIEVLDLYGCGAQAQVVGGQFTGSPLFLPDGTGIPYTNTINISGFPTNSTLTNVNMLQAVCVDMEHSFMGQLEMRLYAPNGNYVVLKEQPGGSNTNLGEPVANGPVDTNNPDTTMGLCYNYCFMPNPTYSTMVGESNNYTYTYTDVLGTVLTDKYLPAGSYEPFQPMSGLLGTPLNGNWTIWVKDFTPQNNGWICAWRLSLTNSYSGDTVVITQPAAPVLTAVVTNASCGTNNGNVNLTVSGTGSPFTYLWSNGATTQDINNVGAGSYTVTVTNASGCPVDTTFLVSNTTAPTVTQSVTNVFCPGGNNGAVDITVTGSGPFTYHWSNNATTQDISNVVAGTYLVTVTGSGGCQRIVTATVNQIPAMVPSATVTNEQCGQEDGGIQLQVTGGTAPYTYQWSNGATTSLINLLQSGSYTVTIHDANNCTRVQTYSVINVVGNCFIPCDLTLQQANVTHESCGNGVGAVDLTVATSNLPVSYIWSIGATSQDLTGLSAGTYAVTITDGNNCTLTQSFTVNNQTGGLAISNVVASNEYCGNGQGGVTLAVSGGAGPYTYAWSNGATTAALSNVHAGTYSLTVTDGNGCQVTTSATVANQSGTLAITWASAFPENCGNGQGSIDILASGGFGLLSYLWSNGATTEDLVPVGAGSYSVTVTDQNGCSVVGGPYVVNNIAGSLNIYDIDIYDENCSNGAGAINLDISGGALPLTYLWSNGATTQDLNGISAGTYTCTVTDANGCAVSSGPVTVQNNAGNLSLATIVQPEICGNGNGGVNLTPSGGTAPYTYLWSTASNSQDLVQVHSGSYIVTVTDANGCVAVLNAFVPNQPGALNITNAVTTPEACGNHAGGINLSIGGSMAPVSYLWSNGATTQDLVAIGAGLYSVTVTDGSGCSATGAYNVLNQSGTLTISGGVVTNATCGNPNGSIDLSVSGGTTPYTYLWSNGFNVQDVNGSLPGTFTCTVTDGAGCIVVAGPYVIGNSSGNLAVTNANIVQPVCSNSNGDIDLTVTGQAPVTYLWNGGATTQDRLGVPAGAYSVTITDGNGCQATWSTTLVASPGNLTASVQTIVDEICGNSNGRIVLAVNGGISTYNYLWSNGATTATLNGVPAGTYSVTVTNGGCSVVLSGMQVSNQSGTLNVLSTLGTPATCNSSNGAVDVTLGGGNFPITYLWSNGATTQDLTNVGPGVYVCTITDASGCTQVVNAVVQQSPGNLALVSANSTAATCGQSNGGITLTMGGGTGNLTYQWSNGATTANLTGVPAGIYTCLVTDQSGCQVSYSGQVSNNGGAIAFPGTNVTDAQCSGANGSIDISPSGGTPPYVYAWSNGATTQDLSGIGSGNYTVTVTDGSGCTATLTTTVASGPGSLVVNLTTLTAASCGNANGAINITPSGGGSTYTFQWSNGATTEDITSVPGGTYLVTVTANNGCSTVETFTVPNQTNGAAVSGAVVSDETCGNNTGGVNISITGGSAPFTYAWSNGATTQDLSAVHAGTYGVTITDGSGCSFVAGPYTVFNLTGTLSVTGTVTPELCGNGQGRVDVAVVGGTGPYTYLWSNGAVTQDLVGVVAGNYAVTVTDGSGCQVILAYTVPLSQGTISVASAIVTGTFCGQTNGGIDITPSGGTPPYTYHWSNNATTQDLTAIQSGIYGLTLTDAAGCEAVQSYTVPNDPGLTVTNVFFADEYCGQLDGYIQVDVIGGDSNYTYTLNGGQPQNFNFYFGLAAGTYTVEIVDGQGCSTTTQVTIGSLGQPFTLTSTITNASCATCANGAIDITMNPPGTYTFFWNTGDMTEDISGLLPGTYDVQIDNGFCFLYWPFIVGDATSTTPVAGIEAELFPNPTNGKVTLRYRLDVLQPLEIEVVDMLGKTLLRRSLPESMGRLEMLDLGHLPDGQYIVLLKAGESLVAKHLVLQK